MDRGLLGRAHVDSWLVRFALMLDGLLGADHASTPPPGGVLFLTAAVVGYALAAVCVSAIG